MKGKNIIAILLSLTMCLSVISVSFAATTDDTWPSGNVPVVTVEELKISESENKSTNKEDTVIAAAASDTVIYTSGDLEWSIDVDGLLVINGIGNYDTSTSNNIPPCPPWCNYEFKTAVVTVKEITSTRNMFHFSDTLENVDLSGLDTSNVTDMGGMFSSCTESLTSLDVSNFDTSNVTDMGNMFNECESLKNLDISNFDTSNVTNMGDMFAYCESLRSLDVSNFDTSNVIDMTGMFFDCATLKILDVSTFNTSKTTDMSFMFSVCENLESLNISKFDTSNVTDMRDMFSFCRKLTSLDVSNFDTSNVTDMFYMFGGCSSLINLDVNSFNTSNVTCMDSMFNGCSSLTSLDLSNFDTSNVTDMDSMFEGCSSLTSLDLSNFDTSNVESMNDLLDGCSGLITVTAPANLKYTIKLPSDSDCTWYDENGAICTEMAAGISTPMVYMKNSIPSNISDGSEAADYAWTFGQDNFCFTNESTYFGSGAYYIEDGMFASFLETLSDTQRKSMAYSFGEDSSVENFLDNKLTEWGGSCFGMSLVVALIKTGNLSAEDLGASTTYGLAPLDPSENTDLESIINLYLISQTVDLLLSAEIGDDDFPEMMECMWYTANEIGDGEEPYVVCLYSDKAGHAVVCYGAETGHYSMNSGEYDKRLLIYNPNSSEEEYIYINDDFTMAELSSDSSYTSFGICYGQVDSETWSSFSEYMDIPHYVYLNVHNSAMPSYTVHSSHGTNVSILDGTNVSGTLDADIIWGANRLADGDEIDGSNDVYTVYLPDTGSYYEIEPAEGETMDALLTYDDFSVNICGKAASTSIGIDGTVKINEAEGDLAVDITLNDSEFDYVTISGAANGDVSIRITDESIDISGDFSDYTIENMDNDCESTSSYISGDTDVEVVMENKAVAPYENTNDGANDDTDNGANDDTTDGADDDTTDGADDDTTDGADDDTNIDDDVVEVEIPSLMADTLLVRRGNWFYVNYTLKGGNADMSFTYGRNTDEVLIGDWDGDGIDTICVRRGNRFYFSNTLGGQSDFYIDFGRTTDEVVVGDWDGDGCDTICVRRGNHYYINNTLESGDAAIDFTFGRVDDEVLAGDWNGDGYDTLCIRRGITYYINNTLESGNAAIDFTFGRAADSVLAGDWDGDGYDTLCIRRGNHYYINNTLEGGNAAIDFTFGRDTDEVYAGTWI